jgi:hypothetical protein
VASAKPEKLSEEEKRLLQAPDSEDVSDDELEVKE